MTPGLIEENVHFLSEGLQLEGILSYPETGEPQLAILLLAPHPHFGGNMKNNVICKLARRAAADGAACLRFNYRGVGSSAIRLAPGESRFNHWAGMERERRYHELAPDGLEALETVVYASGEAPVAIIGYSLGAILAGMIADHPRVVRIVAISPPVERVGLDAYRTCAKPVAFFVGGQDFVSKSRSIETECAQIPGPWSVEALPECDHFFRKQEDRLYDALVRFLFEGMPSVPGCQRHSSDTPHTWPG